MENAGSNVFLSLLYQTHTHTHRAHLSLCTMFIQRRKLNYGKKCLFNTQPVNDMMSF